MINIAQIISRLERSSQAIQALVDGVDEGEARWKPRSEDWAITEVICHLADEEVEDFRTHVNHLLFHADQPWPGIDPQGWVSQRKYLQQDHCAALQRFMNERQDSLLWLSKIDSPNWENGMEMPYGKLTAGDVLTSWVAHDLLHLRQLIELHYAYLAAHATPYDIRYAGEW